MTELRADEAAVLEEVVSSYLAGSRGETVRAHTGDLKSWTHWCTRFRLYLRDGWQSAAVFIAIPAGAGRLESRRRTALVARSSSHQWRSPRSRDSGFDRTPNG